MTAVKAWLGYGRSRLRKVGLRFESLANLLPATTPQTVCVWPRCDAASLAEIDLGTSAANADVANAPRSVIAHEPQRDCMRPLIKTFSLCLSPILNLVESV